MSLLPVYCILTFVYIFLFSFKPVVSGSALTGQSTP